MMPKWLRWLAGRRQGTPMAANSTPHSLSPAFSEQLQRISACLAQHDYPAALVLLEPMLNAFDRDWQLQAAWAQAQQGLGEFDEAARAWRRVIELQPDAAMAAGNLALLEFSRARYDQAHHWIAHAAAIEGPESPYHHTRLGFLNYDPAQTQAAIRAAHLAWGQMVEAEFEASDVNPDHRNHARLRVGYVSADFCAHSTNHFIVQLLNHHDRSRFEIYCYYNRTQHDSMTTQLAGMVDHWRDIPSLSDEAVAALIREDEIDVLVDLAGHTVGNRLRVFARRVAPVQATWLGYPQTTGLARMDYRISDQHVDPVTEQDKAGSEKVYRLPKSMICFAPPTGYAAQLEVERRGQPFTFGIVAAHCKLSDACVKAFSAVLASCPEARLLCFHQQGCFQPVRDEVLARFERFEGDTSRIEVRPWCAPEAFVTQLSEIDLVLDSFPYNGGTTNNLCLWAGVPFVTLSGDTPPSRCGAMLLTVAGLEEFIARDESGLVSICASMARDPDQLRSRRHQIAAAYRCSAISDYQGFARRMEEAYLSMWQCRVAENIR